MDISTIDYEIVKEAPLDELIVLYKDAGWWSEENDGVDPTFIDKIIKGSFCFVIARFEGKIIGMGRCISDGVSDGYIQDVVVLSEYRNNGIGQKIIQCIISDLKSKGLSWIGLISEPGAENFYHRLHFEEMRGYTPFIYKG